MRLVAGPQSDECGEIFNWGLCATVSGVLALMVFFVLLAILSYSFVIISLFGAIALMFACYLYYVPMYESDDIAKIVMEKKEEI